MASSMVSMAVVAVMVGFSQLASAARFEPLHSGLNYFDAIGVPWDASTETIKAIFRKKIMIAHSDKGGDLKLTQDLNIAWETLQDDFKREEYRRTLGNRPNGRLRTRTNYSSAAMNSDSIWDPNPMSTADVNRIFAFSADDTQVAIEEMKKDCAAKVIDLRNERHDALIQVIRNAVCEQFFANKEIRILPLVQIAHKALAEKANYYRFRARHAILNSELLMLYQKYVLEKSEWPKSMIFREAIAGAVSRLVRQRSANGDMDPEGSGPAYSMEIENRLKRAHQEVAYDSQESKQLDKFMYLQKVNSGTIWMDWSKRSEGWGFSAPCELNFRI